MIPVGGATFKERDMVLAKGLVDVLNLAKFTISAKEMVDGGACINWFIGELMPTIKNNLFEVKKIVEPVAQPVPDPQPTEPTQ